MELIGTSKLQKGGRVKISKEGMEKLTWVEKGILVQFLDEKNKSIVIKRIEDIKK